MSDLDTSHHATAQAGRIVCLLQALVELMPDDKLAAPVGLKTIAGTALDMAEALMLRLGGDNDVKLLGEQRL